MTTTTKQCPLCQEPQADTRALWAHMDDAHEYEMAQRRMNPDDSLWSELREAAAPPTPAEYWIRLAQRAGKVTRETAFDTRTGARLRRAFFPAVLERVLAPRMDGTLTAARRAWVCAVNGW